MQAKNQAHSQAAALHQLAANQHLEAAHAHEIAAQANQAAANPPAAKLDKAAAADHRAAAAQHNQAAGKHQVAGSGPPAKQAQVAAAAVSRRALAKTQKAAGSTDIAVAADPQTTPVGTTPAQQQAAQEQVTKGQLAKAKSDDASNAAANAAQQGVAAANVGTADSDPLNRLIESLGLTGLTKSVLDHNRFFALSFVLGAVLFIFFYGTEPKIDNPLYTPPGGKCCAIPAANPNDATLEQIIQYDPDLQPLDPSKYFTLKRVTASELQAELNSYLNDGEAQIKRLQADLQTKSQQVQDALAKIQAQKDAIAGALKAVSVLAIASTPATGPIGPLIGIVTGLLTAGLAADNVRKNTIVSQTPDAQQAKS